MYNAKLLTVASSLKFYRSFTVVSRVKEAIAVLILKSTKQICRYLLTGGFCWLERASVMSMLGGTAGAVTCQGKRHE